eukprot:1022381-Pelagomonas_calceolata.AAC.2
MGEAGGITDSTPGKVRSKAVGRGFSKGGVSERGGLWQEVVMVQGWGRGRMFMCVPTGEVQTLG